MPIFLSLNFHSLPQISNEYRYPAHYISGTSHGWPDHRSVNFAAPPEKKLRERQYQDGVRSKRKKIGSRKSTSSNGTRNRGYVELL